MGRPLASGKVQGQKNLTQGTQIDGQRGCVYISMLELSKRWGWGREIVKRFLNELENDGMARRLSVKNLTMIIIENYGDYQNSPAIHQTTDTTTDATTHRQQTEQRIDTSNKYNNINKDNKVNNGEERKEGKEGKECKEGEEGCISDS